MSDEENNIVRLDTKGFLLGVANQLEQELDHSRIRTALVVVVSDQGELRVLSSNGDQAEGIAVLSGAIDVWSRSTIDYHRKQIAELTAQIEQQESTDGGGPDAA